MITLLSDGNILLENKKNIYKYSTSLIEQYDQISSSFLPITTSITNTSNISAIQDESLNLNFAYNMNQYVRDSDTVKFANLTITGDTLLCGNLNIIPQAITKYQTTVVNIGDTLIELASNNLADNIDIGLYGKYVKNSVTNYAGIYRDAQNNGIFKLFKDLTIQPNNAPGAHINVSNTTTQGDLMINSLYTGYIKCADFYYNLNINAKNGDNINNSGGDIILNPGTGYNLGTNGNIIISYLPLVSNTETLLGITSDGKLKKTNLVYNNISINNTEAKVKSVNGQTGDVVINLSGSAGVTSLNGLTGDITGVVMLNANNTLTLSGTNTDTSISSNQKLMVLDTSTNNVQRINMTADTVASTAVNQTFTGIPTFNRGVRSELDFVKNSMNLTGINSPVWGASVKWSFNTSGGEPRLKWEGSIVLPFKTASVIIPCPISGNITTYNCSTTISYFQANTYGISFVELNTYGWLYYVIDTSNLSATYNQNNFRFILSSQTRRDLMSSGIIDYNSWILIAYMDAQYILTFYPFNCTISIDEIRYNHNNGNLYTGTPIFTNNVTLSGTNAVDTTISSGQKLMVLDTATNNIKRVNITPDTIMVTSAAQTISGEKTFNQDKLKVNNIYSTGSSLNIRNDSNTNISLVFYTKAGVSADGWVTLDTSGSSSAGGVAIQDDFHVEGNQAIKQNLNVTGQLSAANISVYQQTYYMWGYTGYQIILPKNGLFRATITTYSSKGIIYSLVEQYIVSYLEEGLVPGTFYTRYETNSSNRVAKIGNGDVLLTDGMPFGNGADGSLWIFNNTGILRNVYITFEFLHSETS